MAAYWTLAVHDPDEIKRNVQDVADAYIEAVMTGKFDFDSYNARMAARRAAEARGR